MNNYNKLNHTTWECQVSSNLDSEIPEKGNWGAIQKDMFMPFVGVTLAIMCFGVLFMNGHSSSAKSGK